MSERLLPLVRPIYETQGEIADAITAINESPDLQTRLERQIQFDDQIVTALQSIALTDQQIEQLENWLVDNPSTDPVEAPPPPGKTKEETKKDQPADAPEALADVAKGVDGAKSAEEAAEKEEEEKEEAPRARPVTILVAVSIGIIATIALIAYMVWDQMANSFSGRDQVTELLDSANTLNGDEFEAVSTNTANLKDWFFLKSDMRWFAVPKEFADTPTLGYRVSKFKGADIGEILGKDKREILMFLFHPADLGVKIRKGKWAIVDGENWVGGVTAVEDCCFIVAFKGKHSEMQEYLDKKLKK